MRFQEKKWHSLLWGALLILLGLVVLFGNMGFFHSEMWELIPVFWPVTLILAGAGMIAINMNKMKLHEQRRRRNKLAGLDETLSGAGGSPSRSPFGGFILVAMGAAFLLDGFVRGADIFLPVFLIGLGLTFILKYKLFPGVEE